MEYERAQLAVLSLGGQMALSPHLSCSVMIVSTGVCLASYQRKRKRKEKKENEKLLKTSYIGKTAIYCMNVVLIL